LSDGVDHAAAAEFERHRPRLLGLGYRMLGSLAEAEDVVQEAYLRWHRTPRAQVQDPLAWLIATVTRLAIDELRRQRVRRQSYVGPWLPEPWVMADELAPGEAEQQLDLADDLSVAFLLLLERLAPAELLKLFAADAELLSDGGGKAAAALRPIRGGAKIVRFFLGVSRGYDLATIALRECLINGDPGFVARDDDGTLLGTFGFWITDGLIERVYVVRNPDKLKGVNRLGAGV
jgi:DNA-directed RNA polymerase specialized sigma24 family protein